MTDGSITYRNQMKEVLVNNLNDALPDKGADIIYFKSTYQPENLPSFEGNYWFGFTMQSGEPNFFLQIVYGLYYNYYTRVYNKSNDTWESWKQI